MGDGATSPIPRPHRRYMAGVWCPWCPIGRVCVQAYSKGRGHPVFAHARTPVHHPHTWPAGHAPSRVAS